VLERITDDYRPPIASKPSLLIEGGGGLSESENQTIHRRGLEEGKRIGWEKRDDGPSWHEIALACEAKLDRLKEREQEFVQDMTRRTVRGGGLTEKQENWLRSIYAKARK
jgi:hypothetical protein